MKPLKITHVFVRYPNPYQPYNVLLIDRQRAGGMLPFAFSFYGSESTGKANYSQKLIKAIKGILIFRLALQFRKASGKSLIQSLIYLGGLLPIVRSRPDVIHVHHIQVLGPDFLNFLSFFKTPWVVSLRGSDVSIRPLLSDQNLDYVKAILNKAFGIHAVSENLKKAAMRIGATEERVFVIRRTVDDIQLIGVRPTFNEEEMNLAIVGRYHWSKGLVFALQALKTLLDRKYIVQLHLIGDGTEEQESEIRYWIQLLGLKGSVVMHGYLNSDQINTVLAKTHIYLQSSVSEGIPNALIRAVVNRVPVVASRVGGIPEVITDQDGILVPPGDPVAIADAIVKIWTDKPLRDRIVSMPASINFDPSVEMAAYKDFYSKVLSHNASKST